MNFLSWNVRGLGKGEKCLNIRKLVVEKKINFLGLIETKHRQPLRCRLKRMWGSDDFEYCESFASETYVGRIVTVWDQSIFRAHISMLVLDG